MSKIESKGPNSDLNSIFTKIASQSSNEHSELFARNAITCEEKSSRKRRCKYIFKNGKHIDIRTLKYMIGKR